MSETLPGIERLPLPTQAKLRSTQILTTLPQIISELLQNSIDANATHIDIGIDCAHWACWVRDDGHGIAKDDLELMGQSGNAGRYSSSKEYVPGLENSHSTFGFRGEALASAADIACLEVFSRTSKSRNTWSVILKGGEVLYKGPAVRWKRETPGTVVYIRDIFYNLPVRRRAHTPPHRTWELVRREIEVYSLVFPQISFTLEDNGRLDDDASLRKDRTIRIPKNTSTLGRFQHIYGRALTEHIEPIDITRGTMRMEGFISLIGAPSKAYQFLYINRHPIINDDLIRIINHAFASSSFGKNALDEEGETNTRSITRRSPRKIEKRAVYVINISISPADVDNGFGPDKTIVQFRNKSDVASLLASTIQSFLEKHNFLNQHCNTLENTRSVSPSPRKRTKQEFDDSGYAESEPIHDLCPTTSCNDNSLFTEPLNNDYVQNPTSHEIIWEDPCTGERFVIDSRTGNSYRQTGGHSQAEKNTSDSAVVIPYEGRRCTIRRYKPSNAANATTDDPGRESVPSWLQKALENNRAYPAAESKIPSVIDPLVPYQPTSNLKYTRPHNEHENDVFLSAFPRQSLAEQFFNPSSASTQQFTKHDLRHAEIINQVDRKFIACRILRHSAASQPSSVVVLIDQHAADERIRVERFLKELFLGYLNTGEPTTEGNSVRGVQTRELNPPQLVLLTYHEALMIKRSQDTRDALRNWGVQFAELSKVVPNGDETSESGGCIGYSQLLVSSIPEVVSDKLLQGDELRDFIKGFLAQIQRGELISDTSLDFPSTVDQEEFFWLKAVRRCPRGLLELIKSKACRGAIMFSDTLSISQCEHLVKQLSCTAFPFQCAHGRFAALPSSRPSLVPLAETRMLNAKSYTSASRRSDWARFTAMMDA